MPFVPGVVPTWCRPMTLRSQPLKTVSDQLYVERKTALLERYLHLGITARCCLVHGQGNAVKIQPHNPPCRVAEYDNGNLSARQILLIADSFVGCEEKVEPFALSYSEQIAVRDRVPSAFSRLRDLVQRERPGDAAWRA